MVYLLGDQNFYFPSSDDQSYLLKTFLQNKSHQECQLPLIVKIKSMNIPSGPVRSLLTKNTPILLLELDQLQSILAEYHSTIDHRRDHSHRYRLKLPQGKLAKKFLSKKRFSHSSLITFTNSYETTEQSDDETDYTRTIVRTLNESRSSTTIYCRIPLNYQGYFELLNENDQSMEPYHRLSDLLRNEENECSTNLPKTEKMPQSFVLRSTCLAYMTKSTTIDERKQSGSGDSCYGSLSDLESQKNLLILSDEPIVLSSGQILTILSQCSAHRRFISIRHSHDEQFISSSSASAWLRQKSRFLFQRRKSPPPYTYETTLPNKQTTHIEIVFKCRTERGEIVYIPPDTTGLFSPVRSPNSSFQSSSNSDNVDISGVFQLKYLLNNLRFPISVRLLDNSLSVENMFLPAMIQQQELNTNLSTKFRLLLPFTEQVVYACPLIISSTFKTQPIVIPIPVNTDMQVQRCLNMREICQNRLYHDLIHVCSRRLNEYRKEFSFIHFPILLNPSASLTNRRKMPLFRKRAQSESHLEYSAWDFTSDNHRKSCEILYDHQCTSLDETPISDINREPMFHRDSFQTLKQKFAHQTIEPSQQTTTRRTTNYTKIKFDRPRKSSQQQDLNSDDENYREVDHIYDYIRSGDLTDDVKRIQAKEQAFNAASRQRTPKIHERRFSIPNPISQTSDKISTRKFSDSPASSHTRRFPHYLDDSRPLDSEIEDDVEDIPSIDDRKQTVQKAT